VRMPFPALDWPEVIAGCFTVAGAAFAFHLKARSARKERESVERKQEFHDAFILALNNGAGVLVTKIVKSAIADALDNHQVKCPLRPLVESLDDRMTTQERRQ
jgi:hypothetical protein